MNNTNLQTVSYNNCDNLPFFVDCSSFNDEQIMNNLAERTINKEIEWRGSIFNVVTTYLTGWEQYEYRPFHVNKFGITLLHNERAVFRFNRKTNQFTISYTFFDGGAEFENRAPTSSNFAIRLYEAIIGSN